MEYNRPIYDIKINDALHLGVDEIAFVHDPAIEELWVAMNKEVELKLAQLEDKQILIGAALIPDKLIYRVDKKGNEYYIKFSAETIKQIIQRYFTQNKQINFNLEHNKKNDVNGVIIESWVVEDSMIDKSVLYGLKNVPVGTWMISVKVEDKQFWDEYVKTNKVRGFSIEGAFGQELVEMMANRQELVDPKSGETQDEFIGRCVGVHINEGYDPSQAAAICYSKWDNAKMSEEFRRGDKISFDYDGTLSTILGKEMARRQIKSGSTVYIISARDSKDGMLATADMLNIPHDRVFATGSNDAKIAKIKELSIDKHFDNNNDVVRKLPKIGVSFSLTEDEAIKLITALLKDN